MKMTISLEQVLDLFEITGIQNFKTTRRHETVVLDLFKIAEVQNRR